MILIKNVMLSLDTDFSDIKGIVANYLSIGVDNIYSAKLHRKSVDARKKDKVCFCCSFTASLSKNIESRYIKKNKNCQLYTENKYNWNKKTQSNIRPVVVGFGPAGMFAALLFARSGMRPIVIERGDSVDIRKEKIDNFFNGGKLDINSNVQFGEGGAGTFSDGKLNTGIKDNRCRTVIDTFYQFGAKEEITFDAKPHIGTDILIKVVKNIREEIIALGGEIHFNTKADEILFEQGKIYGVKLSTGEIIETKRVILAIGHSARDTFEMLKFKGISMERKPFAMGVRIEHLQSDINKSLYGEFANHPALSAAPYKLAVHLKNGRGVYTFCMCPGGQVINASSEENGIAVNGMSYSARDGENANSALLVGVLPEDLPGNDVLSGIYMQRDIEQKAYNIGNGKVPITTVGNFVFGEKAEFTRVNPTVKPKTVICHIDEIYPTFITDSLKEGIELLDKKLSCFSDKSAVITAPETRSSSPVRILRNETYNSVSVSGLYPCGEGAGYAGGIVSAAVDGLRCAEKVIESLG